MNVYTQVESLASPEMSRFLPIAIACIWSWHFLGRVQSIVMRSTHRCRRVAVWLRALVRSATVRFLQNCTLRRWLIFQRISLFHRLRSAMLSASLLMSFSKLYSVSGSRLNDNSSAFLSWMEIVAVELVLYGINKSCRQNENKAKDFAYGTALACP